MKKNMYKLFYNSSIDVIKILFPIGFYSEEIEQGYAHFIEHILIRNNYNILKNIELNGGWFNGTTHENNMEIIIYLNSNALEYNNSDKIIKEINLFNLNLSKYDIENEIKVIKNEYETLLVNNNKDSIEQRIGSIEQIEKFNIDKVEYILKNIIQNIRIYMFSKRYLKKNNPLGTFNVKITNKDQKYIISGHDKYSSDKLRLIFNLLSDMGYSNGIIIDNNHLYIEKNIYEYINTYLENISKRFKILISMSFSKYSIYLNAIEDNPEAFFDFDFYNLWRKINEKKKNLC